MIESKEFKKEFRELADDLKVDKDQDQNPEDSDALSIVLREA